MNNMYNGRPSIPGLSRNALHMEIPGFPSRLRLNFPDGRLPVCTKCKKNFKTREMCRIQGGHTSLPWTSVYACLTLDDSCIDSNNKLKKGNYVAKSVGFSPYCYTEDVASDTLICVSCKVKNYTRKQCRAKSRHRALPWSTIHAKLFCETFSQDVSDTGETSNRKKRKINEEEEEVQNKKKQLYDDEKKLKSSENSDAKIEIKYAIDTTEKEETDKYRDDGEGKESNGNEEEKEQSNMNESDSLNYIPESKTFLLEISSNKCVIKWLEMDKQNPFLASMMLHKEAASQVQARTLAQIQPRVSTPAIPNMWPPQRGIEGYAPDHHYPPIIREQPYQIVENPYIHQVVQFPPQPFSSYSHRFHDPRSMPVYQGHYSNYYQEIYEPQAPPQGHYIPQNWYVNAENVHAPQVRTTPPRPNSDQNDVPEQYPYVQRYHI